MSDSEKQRIVVYFKPELMLPPEELVAAPYEKAGYHISEPGQHPTYRVFAGNETRLYPADRVHAIHVHLRKRTP